jgi:formylglycine-generating enzyme required for sulfatase activity
MIYVEGGTFEMGDVFREGVDRAQPVHEVTVSGFYLDRYEVTVAQFAAFVEATGYTTSAEPEPSVPCRRGTQCGGQHGPPPGAGVWILSDRGASWDSGASWKNPRVEQPNTQHPVTGVSWTDAASYCNWLSARASLPAAYDAETGDLLDADGKPTTDVTKVKGYRLPTEAEWEYAARQRGEKVRFGNGSNVARSTEMNVDTRKSDPAYAKRGEYHGGTMPVGSFRPNSLGLYDMSGNVWEWCSDLAGAYPSEAQTNPYQTKGMMGPRRAARGGRWSGDAGEARVAVRMGWTMSDRCNNIGFRVARSK